MARTYMSGCVKPLLKLTVFLMFVLSTSSTKQFTPKKTERDGYVIRNVGIKLCQLKCAENVQCLSMECDIETLTCRFLRAESTMKTMEGHVTIARDHSHVPPVSCTSCMCSLGQRCLKTRSGKEICVQDEKENDPEKSPQPRVDKQESFAKSPLHEACWNGNLHRVESLSRGLVDINIRDKEHGKTPLMVAAQKGHCKIFQFLIRKEANMSEVDNDGKNALHWACKGGYEDMLGCVLQHYKIYVNNGKSEALTFAVLKGQKDLCEFLVCKGANVSGFLIHLASRHGKVGIVKYFLKHGVIDVNFRLEDGTTPLMTTAMFGKIEVFDFLVRRGANMSLVDASGGTILHGASRNGETEMVQHIISKDIVDINSRGRNGMTPLMEASSTGHIKTFGLLVRKGGLVDLVDDNGDNILHLASSGGHFGMVKHILSQNLVDINAKNKVGKTAAMIAKRKRKSKVFDILVRKGCLVN